jgi:HTH-type transcriptional regulator/antitoxin HigA
MTSVGMQIHPIRTEADHELAVKRIEKLIGASPDSAEGDELDILATLVDAYEAKHPSPRSSFVWSNRGCPVKI